MQTVKDYDENLPAAYGQKMIRGVYANITLLKQQKKLGYILEEQFSL
jgi:hypothetical protein